MTRLVFVGSKEDDVVLVVRRDADEPIGSESDILYAVRKTRMGMDLVRCPSLHARVLVLKTWGLRGL